MEIPDLVRRTLGDEELEAAVNLGDEDIVCFTPSRTILYRGEGLLSDEGIEVYDHDVERLDISTGRRKTSFTLEYVEGTETFSVKNGRGDPVLERLLTGILGTRDVIDRSETVEGVFLFSELTMVVTEARLLKHIGSNVWDDEFQEYEYEGVTGLEFEQGSVATQIVLSVGGRPQRIKIPSDDVGVLRQTLENALFAYYDVESLQQLNEAVEQPARETQQQENDQSEGLALDETISPLVGEDTDEDTAADGTATGSSQAGTTRTTRQSSAGTDTSTSASTASETQNTSRADTVDRVQSAPESGQSDTQDTDGTEADVSAEEIDAIRSELSELRTTVERQTKVLQQQEETIEELIEELRRRH